MGIYLKIMKNFLFYEGKFYFLSNILNEVDSKCSKDVFKITSQKEVKIYILKIFIINIIKNL